MKIAIKLPGNFSLENALAAATLADALGIGTPTVARALGKIARIPGRAEKIDAHAAAHILQGAIDALTMG